MKKNLKEVLGESLDDHHPPPVCPECGSEDVELHDAEYSDGFLRCKAFFVCNRCSYKS